MVPLWRRSIKCIVNSFYVYLCIKFIIRKEVGMFSTTFATGGGRSFVSGSPG